MASAFPILVVASQLLNYLLPGSSYSRPTREPKLRYHAKIQAYNHQPRRSQTPILRVGVRAQAAMPMNKLANTRKSKTHKFSLDLALTFFSQHTKQAKVTCPGSVGHCAVLSLFLFYSVVQHAWTIERMQHALHFQSIISQIPAEAKTSQTHAFAHVANASSSRIAKCQSRKKNVLHFFSVQRLHGSRQVVTRVQSQQKDEL